MTFSLLHPSNIFLGPQRLAFGFIISHGLEQTRRCTVESANYTIVWAGRSILAYSIQVGGNYHRSLLMVDIAASLQWVLVEHSRLDIGRKNGLSGFVHRWTHSVCMYDRLFVLRDEHYGRYVNE